MTVLSQPTRNHVRYEVSMAGGIEEIDRLSLRLEFGLRHIYRYSSTPLVFRLVQYPSVGKGRFSRFFAVLREWLIIRKSNSFSFYIHI